MSDKRNDFIADNDFVLYGEKIIVSPLDQSNIESYLSTYKRASAFDLEKQEYGVIMACQLYVELFYYRAI